MVNFDLNDHKNKINFHNTKLLRPLLNWIVNYGKQKINYQYLIENFKLLIFF